MNKPLELKWQNPYIELISRYILAFVFISASLSKIGEPAVFAKVIYGYDLFPHFLINLMAIILPFIELFAGMALLVGFFPRSAALIISSMLVGFILAITYNLLRGHVFDCGCFGFDKSNNYIPGWSLVGRDIMLFLLGVYVICYTQMRKLCLKTALKGM